MKIRTRKQIEAIKKMATSKLTEEKEEILSYYRLKFPNGKMPKETQRELGHALDILAQSIQYVNSDGAFKEDYKIIEGRGK